MRSAADKGDLPILIPDPNVLQSARSNSFSDRTEWRSSVPAIDPRPPSRFVLRKLELAIDRPRLVVSTSRRVPNVLRGIGVLLPEPDLGLFGLHHAAELFVNKAGHFASRSAR